MHLLSHTTWYMQHSAGNIAENVCGNLVHATLASKNIAHVCRDCKQPVILKKGTTVLKSGYVMKPHFAHSVTNIIKCSGYSGGETAEHLQAKWLLANNIEDFRFVLQSCDTCNAPNRENCIKFNKHDWTVVVEGPVAGTGGTATSLDATGRSRQRRADVLVQLKQPVVGSRLRPWYSLEVRHTHAVSVAKTKELHGVGCGIIEVRTECILRCKDLESDTPYYLQNEHNIDLIPWTCKRCMELVAYERSALWVDYENWYVHQWVYQDQIAAREERYRDIAISRESKRKLLQARGFGLIQSHKRTRFEKCLKVCKGRCVACNAWIYHHRYHNFYADAPMTDTESWWRDAIMRSDFLRNMTRVNKMVFCMNCVSRCTNCFHEQPVEVLERYGLCRLCNTDDAWFDEWNKLMSS
jgi:hypothetical protein